MIKPLPRSRLAGPLLVILILSLCWRHTLLDQGYRILFGRSSSFSSTYEPVISDYHRSFLKEVIETSAATYGLDPDLVRAVIYVESRFHTKAVSARGAAGLMQLTAGTAGDMGVAEPFNPEQNILGGCRYLRSLLDMFDNDLKLGLAAYNAGPAVVRRYGDIPPYPETRRYVEQVIIAYELFKGR